MPDTCCPECGDTKDPFENPGSRFHPQCDPEHEAYEGDE